MAKIDDPIGKIQEHYEGEPGNAGVEAINEHLLPNIPGIGPIIEKVLGFLQSNEKNEKLASFNGHILERLAIHEKSIDDIEYKLESPEYLQMMAVAAERIFWGASETKVRRFAAVVAHELLTQPNTQELQDAAYFIRALDELSEDDIRVLKHLYNHQKHILNENHALTYNEFFGGESMRNMLTDARNLGMQMDEFYSRLHRLSGYGLALPLDKSHGSMGNPDNFAFRMTLLGRRLVDMLVNVGGEITEVRKRIP